MTMKCSQRVITKNIKAGPAHHILSYESAFSEKDILPGQFVSIRIDPRATVLRRPLSVFDAKGKEVSVFYRVVGTGTDILSRKEKGEKIDVLEVLGNGFDLQGAAGPVALVGGGMGIAPLFYLARKMRFLGRDVSVYIGGKSAEDIFFEEEFAHMGCRVCVTTEDGSKNVCGTVCSGLEPDCAGKIFSRIYACGPKGMLKAVAAMAKKAKVPCDVSLEEVMGCGFGACLGCAVKAKGKKDGPAYRMVCKDGPVFDAEEIDWK